MERVHHYQRRFLKGWLQREVAAVHAVDFSLAASSLNLLRRVMVALAVNAGAVESYQAPPATTFLQALHLQIPTAYLLTASFKGVSKLHDEYHTFPQKGQPYVALWVISNFLMVFL